MSAHVHPALYWTPRILTLLFAAFLSLFALDVFEEGAGFWVTVGALFIHLIPVYLVLIALAIAWRREWVGAVLFVTLAVAYVVASGGRQHWMAYVTISGSLLVIGVLFGLNWLGRKRAPGGGASA